MHPRISQIFVDQESRNTPFTRRILAGYPGAEVHHVPEIDPKRLSSGRGRSRSTTLCIAHHRGAFVKPFPDHAWYGVDDAGACGQSLLIGYNCSAACRYCFTRTYFDHPYPTLFSNIDEMLDALETFLSRQPDGRLSTGEFIDSFFLDRFSGTNRRILELLASWPEATLELRTKSDRVDHLPPNSHTGVIVAWSINPPSVIRTIEAGTASFERRLQAAHILRKNGYRIAFRIDPVIMSDAFLPAYRGLAGEIDRAFPWRHVSALYLGAVRFEKRMIGTLAGSKTPDELLDAQHILCPDGKYRPHKYVRLEFYRAIIDGVRRYAPDLPIHLTMEPAYIHDALLPADRG